MNIPRHSLRRRLMPLSVVLLAGTLGGCYYPPYPYPQYSYNYYPAYPAYSSYYYPPAVSPYFYGYPTAEASNGGNGR
jgi:hypothetical protein